MKKILRWIGFTALGLVVILAVAITILAARGRAQLARTFEVTGLLASIEPDSGATVEGEHLSRIHACAYCHGDDLSGEVMIDAPPFRVVASNLTPGAGGIGSTFGVSDWDRVIRHGVRPSGAPLLPIMPSASAYHNLSDADAAKLIAYLMQLPRVDNTLPPSRLKLMGQVLGGLGLLDLHAEVDTTPGRASMPVKGRTSEYGQYLATITCSACHGDDFRGGPALDPESPAAPGLTTVGAWPPVDFDRAVRQGRAPDGRQYHEVMPYESFAYMTDDELEALRLFFATLQ